MSEGAVASTPPRIGRYEVLGHLASGGMAEIVVGRIVGPSGFQKAVVIKRILPHLARAKGFVEMFLDEARIVAGIRHPNVVHVHELGHEGDELFLVMEYLEGESIAGLLRRLLAQKQSLSYALCAYVVAEACAGLHAAHELTDADGNKLRVVHRDVSPHNVIITYGGDVKVLDFGVAVAADRIARTEAGMFKGKFEYSSPEQCRGQPLDRRADIFALGILLYELSTVRQLFKRPGQIDILRAICEQPIVPPTEVIPGYPEELSRIVMKALQRKRERRYQTALEMRHDLLAAMRLLGDHIAPEERLASIVQSLFAERIAEKAEMLRRVRAGTSVVDIPPVEADMTIEVPSVDGGLPPETPDSDPASHSSFPLRDDKGLAKLAVSTDSVPLPRARRTALVAGGLVLAVVVTAGLLGTKCEARHAATAVADNPVLTAAQPAPSPPLPVSSPSEPVSTMVTLRIETRPSKARVLIDGADVGLSPVEKKLDRASLPVSLEIRRDGYQPIRETVIPEVDQRLRLTLIANAASTAARAPASPSPTGSAKFRRFD